MRLGEAIKAVGLGALILALNMLATTVVIFVVLAAQGAHAGVSGDEIASIAMWTAPIGGAALFLAALALLGRRRPERNPYAFALKTWLAYVVIDVGSGLATGNAGVTLTWPMALSMALALAGGLAGAALARPPRSFAPT